MPARRPLTHPRDEIMSTMERIYRYRMTTTSGGNLSILDDDGAIWITPARIDKGSLTRDDIIRVPREGPPEGPHKPSSELPFHRAIYNVRPDLRGIVHAHPVALVAFSIGQKVPDTRLTRQSRQVCGEVGFAPYALPGSEALGTRIAQTFANGHDCVVLENHGVVTAGDSLWAAFERFETLEFAAKTVIKASLLGPVRYLNEAEVVRPRPLLAPNPDGPAPPPATSEEKELRRTLAEFVRRAYRQRLMISTQGAFSARLDAESFLITPHHIDRSTLEIEDLVRVRGETPEPGKTPSSSTRNHRAIYQALPGVQAIVNAYPVNGTAFSVSETPLDTRTIPESYVFLRDVRRLPYGLQLNDGQELAARASLRDPITLLANDGVQVCGTTILDAFDRLEVLESTAEAIILGLGLGGIHVMPDAAIDDLKSAFGLS